MTREKLIENLEDYKRFIDIQRDGMWVTKGYWAFCTERMKRITSILRRLRVCPECHGTGWDYIADSRCEVCDYTGRIG